ncbi:hypothetical protein MBLNU459_g0530t1 [Dothideomycetes sp. NU459]
MTSVLSSLLGQTSITDHEEVLKAADVALSKSKNDPEAQHVKIVALLKLDRFDDALRLLESGGEQLKERARLEWAYALYKAGKPDQAAKAAHQGANASGRGMRHVEAQASYRNEDFERAAHLYNQLSSERGNVVHEDMDLRINSGAVDAQLEWSGRGHIVHKKKPAREDLEAFETAYNAACGSIARGELGQAEVLLRRSKDLCNALDELSEEEKLAEILPITVQQIYVLISQGRLEDASAMASTIDPKNVTESSTQHVAHTNNAAASSEPANPFLSQRILHKSPEDITPDKPFAYQSAAMRRNNYSLDLLSQKYAGIVQSTASAISAKPLPTLDANINSLSAVNAAAHAHNKAGKEALKAVLPVLERRPTDIGLVLVVAQLYILSANHGAAIALFETLFDRLSKSSDPAELDVRFAPGLVGTLVALYSARGQTSHVRAELTEAAKYWQKRQKEPSNSISLRALSHLYKAAGTALLESNDPADHTLASDIFSQLHEQDSEDRYATAGLIAAFSTAKPSSITSAQLSSLTPIDRLISGIDIGALESAGVAKPIATPTPASTKRAADSSVPTSKPNKKIRNTKMPKTYDPSKTPDPERWLPLKDRSYYRPKGGKKNKQKQAMFMQGGVVDESRDASGSRPGTPVVEAKSGGGGAAKNKKKKGKGGKW